MASIVASIIGLSQLVSRFGQSKEIVEDAFVIALTKATIFVEGESKPITPIDKGFLRNATKSVVKKDADEVIGIIYNRTPYASFVHDGTDKWPLSMPPKNPNTVRQFIQEVIDRDGGKVLDQFWEMAAVNVADKLAK
jgi:hypothetical protein